MLKKCFAFAVFCSMAMIIAARAHHGHSHHEPPVLPPINNPEPPIITPPPPPVVHPPINFQLPIVSPSSTILPTDTSGFHAGSDANQNNPAQPLAKAELADLTAKDPRFQFRDTWILFSADYPADFPDSSPYKPIAFLSNQEPIRQFGRIEHVERLHTKLSEPAFLPTLNASYSKVSNEHLTLHDGAVLIRAANNPVFISTKLCNKQVVTRVAGGSIAMISAFDHKSTILNFTDKCCGAVVVYLPSGELNKSHSISLKSGQIAEAYSLDVKPTSHLVATRIEINERIGPHCGLLVSQYHYIRAMRKFNLVATLPKDDLNRILKTAAAMSYVRPVH